MLAEDFAEELAGALVARIVEELLGRSLLDDGAGGYEDDAVGHTSLRRPR